MRKPFISFIASCLLLVSGPALAEKVYVAASGKTGETQRGFGATPLAACTALAGIYGYPTPKNASGGTCWMAGTGGVMGTYQLTTLTDCPAGQVRDGLGKCVAPEPKCGVPAGQQQTFTVASGTSKSATADVPDAGTDSSGSGFPTSSPTCGIEKGSMGLDRCYSQTSATGGKNFFCTYTGTSTGADAPAGAPSEGKPAEGESTSPAKASGPADSSGNCPKGTVQAGMDMGGTPICMGTGTNPGGNGTNSPKDERPTTGTTTKSTDEQGNEVETQTTTRSNSDGSTTTTTTKTITTPDGGQMVSGETTTSATPGGKQGVPDPDTKDFCTQHPELTACKNSSVSGSCGTIACTGDAIQCATLQQAAALRCAKDEDDKALKASGAYTLGQQVMSGADPLAESLPTSKNGISIAVPSLDSSGWLGGGQCFPDKSFSVQGQTVTIPFSQACSILVALRYALMVAASLVAFKILRGAFLSE